MSSGKTGSSEKQKLLLSKLEAAREESIAILKGPLDNYGLKEFWYYIMLTPAGLGVMRAFEERPSKEDLLLALCCGVGYFLIPVWRDHAHWRKAYKQSSHRVETLINGLSAWSSRNFSAKLSYARAKQSGKLLREICEEAQEIILAERSAVINALTHEHNQGRILADWWRRLRGEDLEIQVTKLFTELGFQANKTPSVADGGIDVVVDFGGGAELLIQCKGWMAKVSVATVRELAGVISSRQTQSVGKVFLGCLVVVNGLTEPAMRFSRANRLLILEEENLASLARLTSRNQALNYIESITPK